MRGEIEALRSADELTADWLQQALGTGEIVSLAAVRIGTGQMSDVYRVRIEYAPGPDAGPASLIAKFAASDQTSRATGVGLGVYEREIRFYRELAPRIGGPLAECYGAGFDPGEGWFTLLIEDCDPATQGDQIVGTDVEHARLAMHELARLHAPVFADPQLGATPWLNQPMPLNQALLGQLLPAFLERYDGRVTPEHREVCERFVASLDGWLADRRPPLGLVHGDYRLDNMLFGEPEAPRRFIVVDWQTVGWGPVMTDAAYMLGGALDPSVRRANEEQLVREYYEALHAHGVRGFDWELCWTEYRRQVFLGLLMCIAPAMIVQRTERGDEMFLTQLARYAEQVIDLDSLSLLPEPGSGRLPALAPEPQEEFPHDRGPEELWNESWYFDAVSEDGSLGVYSRLGRYPNLGVSWVTTVVCGPGRPTVEIVDYAAPLPGADLTVKREGLRLEHLIEEPLGRVSVRAEGTGEAHDDPAAFLRGEPGVPLRVGFDLVWETCGEPYAYRVTTRYEIPCRVSGVVRVGEQEIPFSGVGQRDHSWGTRDWWSAEWVWFAGQLDDGTRYHGVEFRVPDAPALGVGYVQPPEGGVIEPTRVSASEQVGENGLPSRTRIELDELILEVESVAFGPLRLVSPQGAVSEFPRAMTRVSTPDGRTGTGWIEWNRNRSLLAGDRAGPVR